MRDMELLFIIIFVIFDDALKSMPRSKRGPEPVISDAEIITLFVVQCLRGYESDSAWIREIERHYRHLFPHPIDRIRYEERRVTLMPLAQILVAWILRELEVNESEGVIDSAPLKVCHNIRANNNPHWKGQATWGYCASKKEYFWGFKTHLIVTNNGLVRNWLIMPANHHDVIGLKALVPFLPKLRIFGDKGYNLRKKDRTQLLERGIEVVAAAKSNMKPLPLADQLRLKEIRFLVEQAFSTMDRVMTLEKTLAIRPHTLRSRIAFKMLAFNTGALVNSIIGNEEIRHIAQLAA